MATDLAVIHRDAAVVVRVSHVGRDGRVGKLMVLKGHHRILVKLTYDMNWHDWLAKR